MSFREKVYRGTVIYMDLEGGFFGIITEDGESLLPANLKNQVPGPIRTKSIISSHRRYSQ